MILKNLKKIPINDSVLWKKYLSVLGIVSSIVTLLSFFLTAEKIPINNYILMILFLVILVIIFIYILYKASTQKKANIIINDTKVSILEGNIFSSLDAENTEKNNSINIIPVNDYFDTIVDDRIISKKSLHGQFIYKIKKQGKLEQLENTIQTDEYLNTKSDREYIADRRTGRKYRYRLGSVIEFESYILAAFSRFDDDNKAYVSAQEYTNFWMCFWNNIDRIYAGRTINIPLVGAGITRFRDGKPSKQELLETILWTLKVSRYQNTYVDRGINILVSKEDMSLIDFFSIQNSNKWK